jgi:hypothetical protein
MTSVMLGILMIIGLSVEWAYSGEPGLNPSPSPETIWAGGIGSGFRKGLFQAGGTVAAGFGIGVSEPWLGIYGRNGSR